MSEIAPDPKIVERLERLIREVILRGPAGKLPPHTVITKDLANTKIKRLMSMEKWVDLRESISGKLSSQGYDRYGAVQWVKSVCGLFSTGESILNRAVHDFFSSDYSGRIFNDIDADSRILYYFLHFGCGEAGPLPELMLRAYEAGGFPCGWVGKYPKGNLVVYWPYDIEPQFAEA